MQSAPKGATPWDMIETPPEKKILVLGDVMLDRYIVGDVQRISPEAPIPVLRQVDDYGRAGGAANVAANIAALGRDVILVGVIGRDADGDALAHALSGVEGLEADLVVAPGRQTTCKTRVVAGAQQIVRVDREVTMPLPEADAAQVLARFRDALSEAGLLILSDYAKGVLCDTVLAAALGVAKTAGVPVVVDPKRADLSAYRGADLIKPNIKELSEASGSDCRNEDLRDQALIALGEATGAQLLVTLGAGGMRLRREDGTLKTFKASRRYEAADVSGAGDTALAALAVGLAEGRDLDEAIVRAVIAAGVAVTKSGTAVVSQSELDEALEAETPARVRGGLLLLTADAQRKIAEWRARGERIVFTNGCFDLLHPGHVRLLSEAADQGDRLIVGLNSDASVARLKGPDRPIQTERMRAEVLCGLRPVDAVVIFEQDTPLKLIEGLQPDVIVKGADYRAEDVIGADIVEARGGRVHLVTLLEGQSTTRLAAGGGT